MRCKAYFLVGGLLGVCLLAGLVLHHLAEEWVAKTLIRVVKETRHRQLLISGGVDLHLLPRPQLVARQVLLHEKRGGEPFFSADRILMSVDLMESWRKKTPVFERIAIEQGHLRLRRFADGHFNFSDLLSGGQGTTSGVELGSLEIRAEIAIHDEISGVRGQFQSGHLRIARIAGDGDGRGEFSAHFVPDHGPAAQVRLSFAYRLSTVAQSLEISRVDLDAAIDAPTASRLSVRVGQVALSPAKLAARDLHVVWQGDHDGAAYHAQVTTEKLLRETAEKWDVSPIRLAFRHQVETRRVTGEVTLDKIIWNAESAGADLQAKISMSPQVAGQSDRAVAFSGGLNANWSKKEVSGRLASTSSSPGNRLSLDWRLWRLQPLGVDFLLLADDVDLDFWRKMTDTQPASGKTSALPGGEFRGEVRVGVMRKGELKFSNAKLRFHWRDGEWVEAAGAGTAPQVGP